MSRETSLTIIMLVGLAGICAAIWIWTDRFYAPEHPKAKTTGTESARQPLALEKRDRAHSSEQDVVRERRNAAAAERAEQRQTSEADDPEAKLLMIERQWLVDDKTIDGSATSELFEDDDFEEVLSRLEDQASLHADASELTDIYGDSLRSAIEARTEGVFHLDSFVCGLNICMGQATRMSGLSSVDSLRLAPPGITSLRNGPAVYFSSERMLIDPDGLMPDRLRFFLSIDPALKRVRSGPTMP